MSKVETDWIEEDAAADDLFAEHVSHIGRILHMQMKRLSLSTELSVCEAGVLTCLSETPLDTAGRIARRMGVSRSLMSKSVEHLVQNSYIETVPDQQDRRVVHLRLLPKAEPVVQSCRELKKSWFSALVEGVEQADMEVFLRVLNQIRKNMNSYVRDVEQAKPESYEKKETKR